MRACLRSVYEQNMPNVIPIVIDNGSKDDTLEILRKEFPNVKVFDTGENLGFGKANNVSTQIRA